MNERIKQLLGQAYDEAVPETWTRLSSEQLERVYEKFAELIVKECSVVARAHTLDKYHGLMNEYTGIVYVEEAIKNHFGMKE